MEASVSSTGGITTRDALLPTAISSQQKDASVSDGDNVSLRTRPLNPTGRISRQHSSLLRRLIKLTRFVDTEEYDELTLEGVKLHRNRLQDLWTQVNASHLQQIETVQEAAVDELEDRMDKAEQKYFYAIEVMDKRCVELQPPLQPPPAQQAEDRQISVNVNMPMQQHDMKNTWGT